MLWLCVDTNDESTEVVFPKESVVPYSICESEASFVVQLTTALLLVMLSAYTPDITGGAVSIDSTY